jgi:hypothetical protein
MWTDLVMVRGDTRTFEVSLAFADATLPNLAGADVDFHVASLFTKDVTFDDSSGDAEVTIESDDTDGVTPGRYRYDVQITTAAGDVLTPQRGHLTLLADVDPV